MGTLITRCEFLADVPRQTADRADTGPGMSEEFVRTSLFATTCSGIALV